MLPMGCTQRTRHPCQEEDAVRPRRWRLKATATDSLPQSKRRAAAVSLPGQREWQPRPEEPPRWSHPQQPVPGAPRLQLWRPPREVRPLGLQGWARAHPAAGAPPGGPQPGLWRPGTRRRLRKAGSRGWPLRTRRSGTRWGTPLPGPPLRPLLWPLLCRRHPHARSQRETPAVHQYSMDIGTQRCRLLHPAIDSAAALDASCTRQSLPCGWRGCGERGNSEKR